MVKFLYNGILDNSDVMDSLSTSKSNRSFDAVPNATGESDSADVVSHHRDTSSNPGCKDSRESKLQ